ncbi:bifunctional histidinol-phosphatase/imidazoleglycerol-phosphate dehydratase HisB [Fluoribacter gormanii]|uniref:Histidine biosynthesis bifunctional protein HisB n=1 Tax=Fluoribacter gormanii TaxID=464 RepID=A0A377GKB4_9GAMM|nr:bifunctional histidinol-phosphatase/imidazoleglycerol-phosphate dehydratase HisB [Fluoribacter gormanii]KTD00936.1 histidinol-phosphatase/imisazoleglycerol- phosphat e dehydratase [Fluoribacter gormanii]MCW8471836.1 bifunctional histidinol-phosphatase/imidazoleglycerol-phosphate dehydratase HisB [Fluoribacter gormanii]SIQ82565.1 imidazoleglycerol-phosphate dehydratase [Fluoribacter gormanii]STO25054.1 Histidine biosynthesis bifunctional protein hisB [Fluoribacter gormanii]
MQKILFIDRDGTLIEEPFDFQVDSLDKIKLTPHVIPSLLQLQKEGFRFIMVSNQNGIGTPSFPEDDFMICHEFTLDLFSSQGIFFEEIFICPHMPEENCLCRKPKTGLVDQFLKERVINNSCSWVIGDRETDRQFADSLGIKFLPISQQHGWVQVTQTILNQKRTAVIQRKTKETDINLTLILDMDQNSVISTPLPFFNHMLEQVAKHGGFNLELCANGDVEVDDHHLIEDTAIALGEGLKKALGDKWGINRYGFTLPMDEALASVAIDISGRGFCEFKGQFTREFVGGMATEMVPHFFNSLATALGATIHIEVKGQNHHHMIEACFKSLGRALGQACMKTNNALPSTKGVL